MRGPELTAPQALLAGDPEYVWVFHNSDGGYKYNHMATSEVLPDGTLVVAWQRAHAAEGLNDQEIVRPAALHPSALLPPESM